MNKILRIILLTAVLVLIPATVFAGGTALQRTMDAGWFCDDIAGAMHCFDPGDNPNNTASVNVKVYDYDGDFEGTEHLWRADLYEKGMPPCPQSELIDLGAYIACHHYSH